MTLVLFSFCAFTLQRAQADINESRRTQVRKHAPKDAMGSLQTAEDKVEAVRNASSSLGHSKLLWQRLLPGQNTGE